MALREALAAVLGIGLGLLFVAQPGAIVRIHTAGRRPQDRGGEYGSDRDIPERWRRLVQAVGVGCILAGGYFASTLV
jgi:hypothetical protein